jgi:hypothetical protein
MELAILPDKTEEAEAPDDNEALSDNEPVFDEIEAEADAGENSA